LAIKLQGKLRSEGFDPGPLDGQPGKKTCQALVDYQLSYGLQPTAVLNNESLLMLNLDEVKALPVETAIRRSPPSSGTGRSAGHERADQPEARSSNSFPNASWEERFRRAAKKFESRRSN
jgi:peptidoglycan hydrolase-like protein with peptidoglycan-binding domain